MTWLGVAALAVKISKLAVHTGRRSGKWKGDGKWEARAAAGI